MSAAAALSEVRPAIESEWVVTVKANPPVTVKAYDAEEACRKGMAALGVIQSDHPVTAEPVGVEDEAPAKGGPSDAELNRFASPEAAAKKRRERKKKEPVLLTPPPAPPPGPEGSPEAPDGQNGVIDAGPPSETPAA